MKLLRHSTKIQNPIYKHWWEMHPNHEASLYQKDLDMHVGNLTLRIEQIQVTNTYSASSYDTSPKSSCGWNIEKKIMLRQYFKWRQLVCIVSSSQNTGFKYRPLAMVGSLQISQIITGLFDLLYFFYYYFINATSLQNVSDHDSPQFPFL